MGAFKADAEASLMKRHGQTLSGVHGDTPMVIHVLSSELMTFEDERGEGQLWRHTCVDLLGNKDGVFPFHEGVYTKFEARGWVRIDA